MQPKLKLLRTTATAAVAVFLVAGAALATTSFVGAGRSDAQPAGNTTEITTTETTELETTELNETTDVETEETESSETTETEEIASYEEVEQSVREEYEGKLQYLASKVVDAETSEGPLIGKEGLLLVKGPNLMAGYLGDPERTQEALRDGWYVTGDIALMDESGFIFITDRLSRFSKIAGEMVPHLKIEDAILQALGDASCVVTAIPDEARGERLVAFHTDPDITAEVLWSRLCASDLPKLWIPKLENLHCLDAIPTLGTGKVDLKRVRALAQEITAAKTLASTL